MNMEMSEEAIHPSAGPYHSQQLYNSYLLCFKIITVTIRADTGEGPNMRGGKGALTSDYEPKKTSATHKPTKKT